MLQLQPFMAQWRERGLDVVLITADRADRMESFIAENDLNHVYVLLDPVRESAGLYRVQGIPVSIYINRDGLVRHSSVGWGPGSLEEARRIVEHLLD